MFLDTSALLKRYVDEEGAEVVRALDGPFVVSAMARIEAAAALWRKHRLGEISADDAALLAGAVAFDMSAGAGIRPRVVVVGVTAPLIAHASELVERHPLRGYDAIQLASALAARAASPSVGDFGCADRALAGAAAREGFRLVPGLVTL